MPVPTGGGAGRGALLHGQVGEGLGVLRWNLADPVDAAERLPNDVVYSYQTNRNPFIDHPEWVVSAFIPELHISRVGQNVALIWTNEPPQFVIEQSAGVSSGWSEVTNSPALTSTNSWALAVPLASSTRLFRLRLE